LPALGFRPHRRCHNGLARLQPNIDNLAPAFGKSQLKGIPLCEL
jgi:hypothetical protein